MTGKIYLHSRYAFVAGASALALCATVPALAQTQTTPATPAPAASDAARAGVEEIVVTAQFREQNLQKTPLAITAVSGAMLEARSQTNIAQVANEAPSVTLKPQGAAFGPSLGASIRGIGQFDFNPALEPGVGVYVDDVYYATLTGSVFDLLDLDRVEVLRGPQGTLAGKNSIGGAIKLYSKKPVGDNTGYISATYGSRDRMDLRGSADFGLTDNLFARLSGVAKKQGGYIKRLDFGCVYPAGTSPLNPAGGIPAKNTSGEGCTLAKDGDVDYQAARAQLRWEASDTLEINLIGDFTHEDRHTAGSVLTYANYTGTGDINPYGPGVAYDSRFLCGRYCNYATFQSDADTGYAAADAEDRVRYKGYGFSGTIDWKLGDNVALKSITAYRRYSTHFNNDDDFSPLAHSLGRSAVRFHSFSQELRLNGALGSANQFEYTIGGFYQDQRSVYASYQDLRYAGLTPFYQDDPVPADTKAVFAQGIYHLTDQLTLTGGIRYTKESKDYTFSRRNPDGTLHPTLGGLDGVTGHYSGDRVDYRANIQYQFTPELMGYVQYSTGFKGGGINPRPFAATQVQNFGPETLETYEGGVKADLFDRMVRVNAAVFYSNYKDIQLAVLSCPQYNPSFIPPGASFPCALPVNAGDAHIKGAEAEINLRPTEGLSIDGSVSYVDFNYYNVDPITGVTEDMTTPYNPKWKWSIGAQYEIPLGDAGTLIPRIDASYQAMVYTNAVNSNFNRLDSYTIANARLTYRNSANDWEASLEVTNLFDKYYFLTSFDLTGAGAGLSSAQPGRPREWALTVKKKF